MHSSQIWEEMNWLERCLIEDIEDYIIELGELNIEQLIYNVDTRLEYSSSKLGAHCTAHCTSLLRPARPADMNFIVDVKGRVKRHGWRQHPDL